MSRLNGKQPTAREKWVAFYRLWRMAHGKGARQDMNVEDCFRILLSDWRCIRLLEDGVPSPGWRNRAPKFLRIKFLAMERKRRLFGEHYEWLERSQRVANMLREDGIEMTPEDVAGVRRGVFAKVRQRAAELGVAVPADDAALLSWMKRAMSD